MVTAKIPIMNEVKNKIFIILRLLKPFTFKRLSS